MRSAAAVLLVGSSLLLGSAAGWAQDAGDAAPAPLVESSPDQVAPQLPAAEDGAEAAPSAGGLRVRWLPWERRSFEAAAGLKRMVVLYLRTAACRLCQLNEDELLNHPEVAQWIAKNAVPVAVDVDLRPDVGSRYVASLVPYIVFLLPNGEPIYEIDKDSSLERAGGYFTERHDLMNYMRSTHAYFEARSMEILAKAVEVAEVEADVRRYEAGIPPVAEIGPLVERLRSSLDFTHGGFGRGFKIIADAPFRLFRSRHEPLLQQALLKTAGALLGGDIHDGVEGGFHHYATRRDWSVPALEKRLDVNARALRLLVAAAASAPDRGDLRQAVQSTADFITGRLRLPAGGYALAQFGSLGGTDAGSYFAADKEERARLRPPPVETRVVASANAAAAVALLEAAALLDSDDLEKAGLDLVDHLAKILYQRGQGMSRYLDDGGRPQVQGLLGDQVTTIEASLAAYEVRRSPADLERAVDLLRFCRDNLSPRATYFTDIVKDATAVGLLRRPLVSLEDNGRMAVAALRLATITGNAEYDKAAREVLGSLSAAVPGLGWGDSSYVLGLTAAAAGQRRAVIRTSASVPGVGLRRAASLLPVPGLVTITLAPEDASVDLPVDLPGNGEGAGAYLCAQRHCVGPVTKPPDMTAALEALELRGADMGASSGARP